MNRFRMAAGASLAALAATAPFALIGLSGTAVFADPVPTPTPDPNPAPPGNPPALGSPPAAIRQYLGVTDAQTAKFQAVKKKYDDKVNAVLLQLQQLQPAADKEVDAILTPAQQAKIKAIRAKYQQKAEALRKQIEDLQVQGNNEMGTIWTAEQKEKIKKLQAQAAAASGQQSQPAATPAAKK